MSRDIHFQGYVVGLIDFLNQGSPLEALNQIPEDDDQQVAYIEAARATIGVVDCFRGIFREFFEQATTLVRSSRFDALTEEQKRDYERCNAVEIRCQHFSDTTVIYSPLVNREGVLTLIGVHNMLMASGATLLAALANKVAFRGGIEVGIGVEYWANELYGPVLRHAYRLENSIAEYPRIVLGPRVMEFIGQGCDESQSSLERALRQRCASKCRRLVCLDDDGLPIVDYLGQGFREFASDLGYDSLISQARDFVLSQHERFRKEQNHKLALRYARLKQYFDTRMSGMAGGINARP